MYAVSRGLLKAVWEWAGDTGGDDESGWDFGADSVDTRMGAAFTMWSAWRYHNVYPQAGGWLDQPLDLLVMIEAVDLAFSTRSYLLQKGADFTKLSPTQRALNSWLEGGE